MMATKEVETLNPKELQDIRIKLFKLGLLTTDKDVSDKIYEVLDLVEKKIKEAKENG